MTEKELLDLKHEIEDEKEELSKLEGRKDAMMEALKKEYGLESIKAAEKKVEELKTEIENLNADIETATEKLEEQLPE